MKFPKLDNLSDFTCCDNLINLVIQDNVNCVGDISSLAVLPSLVTMDLGNLPLITGDLSLFENKTTLTSLGLQNCYKITGNISILKKLSALTSLNILGDNLITGTLESLCEGMCAPIADGGGNRTSGTLTFRINRGVTFKGSTYAGVVNFTIEFSSTGCTVTVNGQTSTYTKSTNTWVYPS